MGRPTVIFRFPCKLCPTDTVCGLQPLHEAIKFAICLWGEPSKRVQEELACKVLSFQDVLDEGAETASSFQMANVQPDDLATFVYTSGTTGNPKVRLHVEHERSVCRQMLSMIMTGKQALQSIFKIAFGEAGFYCGSSIQSSSAMSMVPQEAVSVIKVPSAAPLYSANCYACCQ